MGPGPAKIWPTVAPEWILNLPEWLEELFFKVYKCFIFDDRYMMFVEGLGNTLLMTLMALLLGVILGVVVALIRASWDKNGAEMRGLSRTILRILNGISKVYLTVIRGTPVVVQLLIWYFVVFSKSRNGMLIGAFAFGINSGAYVAEIIRSGIMSIDVGQMEAGRSLGFGYVATMRHIILPQALSYCDRSMVSTAYVSCHLTVFVFVLSQLRHLCVRITPSSQVVPGVTNSHLTICPL